MNVIFLFQLYNKLFFKGDRQRFLSCLLSLKTEIDQETLSPSNKLASATLSWLLEVADVKDAKTIGNITCYNNFSQRKTINLCRLHMRAVTKILIWFSDELLDGPEYPKFAKAVQLGIDAVNSGATSNAQKIQKWHILKKDFSVPGGELGPTLKVKRHVVSKIYKDMIEKIYRWTFKVKFACLIYQFLFMYKIKLFTK